MGEMQVMYEFLTRGIDREDVEYLRRAYESLLAEDAQGYWLNDTHWVDHPPTDVVYGPPKKKSKRHNNIYEDLQVSCCGYFFYIRITKMLYCNSWGYSFMRDEEWYGIGKTLDK